MSRQPPSPELGSARRRIAFLGTPIDFPPAEPWDRKARVERALPLDLDPEHYLGRSRAEAAESAGFGYFWTAPEQLRTKFAWYVVSLDYSLRKWALFSVERPYLDITDLARFLWENTDLYVQLLDAKLEPPDALAVTLLRVVELHAWKSKEPPRSLLWPLFETRGSRAAAAAWAQYPYRERISAGDALRRALALEFWPPFVEYATRVRASLYEHFPESFLLHDYLEAEDPSNWFPVPVWQYLSKVEEFRRWPARLDKPGWGQLAVNEEANSHHDWLETIESAVDGLQAFTQLRARWRPGLTYYLLSTRTRMEGMWREAFAPAFTTACGFAGAGAVPAQLSRNVGLRDLASISARSIHRELQRALALLTGFDEHHGREGDVDLLRVTRDVRVLEVWTRLPASQKLSSRGRVKRGVHRDIAITVNRDLDAMQQVGGLTVKQHAALEMQLGRPERVRTLLREWRARLPESPDWPIPPPDL